MCRNVDRNYNCCDIRACLLALFLYVLCFGLDETRVRQELVNGIVVVKAFHNQLRVGTIEERDTIPQSVDHQGAAMTIITHLSVLNYLYCSHIFARWTTFLNILSVADVSFVAGYITTFSLLFVNVPPGMLSRQ